MLRRAACAVLLLVIVTLTTTNTASAVSLEPTDWSSQVTSIEPSTDVVTLDIVGGDALAALHVEPGHQVIIRGYENEPYLRVDPDGSVWENVRAPSCSLNRTTDASGPVDANADASAEPEWRRIGSDGTARWHDHRIHPMPGVTDDLDWTIALTVDGSSVTMHGRLARQSAPSPLPWFALGFVVAVAGVVVGRRAPLSWARGGALTAALGATTIALADVLATPVGIDRQWLALVVTGVATVGAMIAVGGRGRLGRRTTVATIGASLALTAGWTVRSLPALTAAVVPGGFAAPVTRAVVAVVGGIAVAAAGLLVLSGGLPADEPDPQAVAR